jgi:molybdate transport system ATP-binding protein
VESRATEDRTLSETAANQGLQLHCRLQRSGFSLDVDLALPSRGITAIFGPSGCGKTTMLRIIAGLEPSATGRVAVGSDEWQNSAKRLFRPVHQRAVGLVFQEASLFDHLSVEGNLKFGFRRAPAAERRQNWDQAIELLGIAHLLKRAPGELSGGERQRVAIARALAASPRVLLMDEPLAAIDAQRKADILPWLERLHNELNLPMVYVTHSLDEVAQLADHMVVMAQGRVQAHGPALSVLDNTQGTLATGNEAWVLIEGTIGAEPEYPGLERIDFAGGSLMLPQTRAAPWPTGHRVRVRIQARDVSIALQRAEHTSVLNILPATVQALREDGPGQVTVSLVLGEEGTAGRGPVLSRISALSAQRLALAPGMRVFAQIKGVAMVR